MAFRLGHVLIVLLAAALAAYAQDIVVGFERDSYNVSEGGSVTICIEIISPDDIGGSQLHLQVEAIENIGQATPDEDDPIFGDYLMNPGADYPPPIIGRVGQIRNVPLTQSRRSVCYEQRAYQDDEEESDEIFSLRVVVDDTVDPSLMVSNLTVDESRGTTQVRILGDIEPPASGTVTCPTLNNPENGVVMMDEFGLGAIATYSCNTGYFVDGPDMITCDENNEWTPSPPTCTPVQCPTLESPTNGGLQLSGTGVYQDTARYVCNEGFNLAGMSERTCQSDGTWNGSAPTCQIVQCPTLENPMNGGLQLSGTGVGVYLETATYACETGFNLVGMSERVCQSDGTWSGSAPTCQIVVCPTLNDPDNGNLELSGNNFGQTAEYTCNTGFNLVGESMLMCGADGQWIGNPPVCEAVQCPDLSSPMNGSLLISGTGVGVYLETATYACETGFNLVGMSERVCQSDGTWSGSDPTCQIVVCPTLNDPANGNLELSGNSLGDSAEYTCNTGYNLAAGDKLLICGSEGQWIGNPPVCIAAVSETVNDTVIGDPLFTVNILGHDESMCYEVRGRAGTHLNLISDTCTSVNTLYDTVPSNPSLHRMRKIGIKAVVSADRTGGCSEIEIDVENCSASIDGVPCDKMAQVGDITVRQYIERQWRVRVPNCGRPSAVMWITCDGEMLRFRIARGSNLAPTSHGLLGQFWGIPVSIVTKEGNDYIQLYDATDDKYREFPYFEHSLTWDHSKKTCYYVGNKQGGPEESHDPLESVIVGDYTDYNTGSLFGTEFTYGVFDDSACEAAA